MDFGFGPYSKRSDYYAPDTKPNAPVASPETVSSLPSEGFMDDAEIYRKGAVGEIDVYVLFAGPDANHTGSVLSLITANRGEGLEPTTVEAEIEKHAEGDPQGPYHMTVEEMQSRVEDINNARKHIFGS